MRFTAAALAEASSAAINITPGFVGPAAMGSATSGNFEARQNTLFTVTFPVIDQTGQPIDLSGSGQLAMVFSDPNNTSQSIFTATLGGAHANLSVGGTGHDMLTLSVDATLTATGAI